MIRLSIIIPTYKESPIIDNQINDVYSRALFPENLEIIVCDANYSTHVKDKRALYFNCSEKGRSSQMNCGSSKAKGDVLYFLHADTTPPKHFDQIILGAIGNGIEAGCFRLKFDSEHFFLKASAWFTRFNMNWCRGGDQSLFISKKFFQSLQGFNDSYLIMEDIDIIQRIRKVRKFKVLKQYVVTSKRKYLRNGIYRLQFLFGLLHLKYRLGYSQSNMITFYRKFIAH